FTVTVENTSSDPNATTPFVAATVRIGTTKSSTTAPLLNGSSSELFVLPTTETATDYTGLVVLNPGLTAATATVEVYGADGTRLGSTIFQLAAGTSHIQLLREMVSNALGQSNGLVHVSTDVPVFVFAARGTFALTELLQLQGQTTP